MWTFEDRVHLGGRDARVGARRTTGLDRQVQLGAAGLARQRGHADTGHGRPAGEGLHATSCLLKLPG